jgi:3-hydroxybutyryl-CoA dehydratase
MTSDTSLSPGRYHFNDIKEGDHFTTELAQVSAELIDQFAEISNDRFEIHMDRGSAQSHGFKDRVAHGLLVLSLVDGLKNNASAQFDAIASLRWDWSFVAPVLAGDWIRVTITILAKRTTRTANKGILTLGFDVRNHHKKLVQRGQNQLMVYR